MKTVTHLLRVTGVAVQCLFKIALVDFDFAAMSKKAQPKTKGKGKGSAKANAEEEDVMTRVMLMANYAKLCK